jgi:4-cresol dehydrogenase (hydroxylating)
VPPRDGTVLIDLSRMNRIVDFDETLGALTVEPGVTFADAYCFLKERGSRFFLNSIGGSPGASLVGNALERGDGAGPHGDRFAHVCALEVVLPTGEHIRTGFGRFSGSRVAPLHRWGVGPSIDGLFSQSRFGIVTQMMFWLAPLPACLHLVRFEVNEHVKLGPLVDALRELRMDGTIRAPIGIWNDYRVVSTTRQYPWELTRGVTPLSEQHLESLKRLAANPATWLGVTTLYAPTHEQGRANRAHVESVLRPVVDRLAVDEHAGEPASGRELSRGDPALWFAQGIPHEASLRSVYWRKKTPVPDALDPDRDGCGVIWVCPVVPFRGCDVLAAVDPAKRILLEHGFDPLLAMVAQTERTIYFVPLLIYDRDVPGEDARARACHDALFAHFCDQGFHPHRVGLQSTGLLPPVDDDYARFMERLGAALDPNGVLSSRK